MSQEPAERKRGSVDGPAQPSGPGAPLLGVGQQLRRARLAIGVSVREMARRVRRFAEFHLASGTGPDDALGRDPVRDRLGTRRIAGRADAPGGVALRTRRSRRRRGGGRARPGGTGGRAARGGPGGRRPGPDRRRDAPLAWAARPFTTITDANSPVQRADSRHELGIGGAIWGRRTSDRDRTTTSCTSCTSRAVSHARRTSSSTTGAGSTATSSAGRPKIQVGFDHYQLNAGDSISFESMTPRPSLESLRRQLLLDLDRGRPGGTPVV